MEGFIGLAVLAFLAWSIYRFGKQIGSRKGYHAGRKRGRRFRF